jgi:hypothetical protein
VESERKNEPWWVGLVFGDVLRPWMLLAAASARRAEFQQSSTRNLGKGARDFIDMRDAEATKKWLVHEVSQNLGALLEHWPLIQRELFCELLEGDNAFARNLAGKRKQCIENTTELIEALNANDGDRFERAEKALFSEFPGGYADPAERHMVEYWSKRPEEDLPPFSCWKDEAMADYLADLFPSSVGLNTKGIEARRKGLRLLKVPIYLLVEWRSDEPERGRRPGFAIELREKQVLDKDAIRWICKQIDFDLFCDAFNHPRLFRFYGEGFMNEFPLSKKLKSEIRGRIEMIANKPRGGVRIDLPADFDPSGEMG